MAARDIIRRIVIDPKKIDRAEWHKAMSKHLGQRGAEAMRVGEVAKLLNVSQRHVYKMVEENQIPFVRFGTAIRFDPQSLAEWVGALAKDQQGKG